MEDKEHTYIEDKKYIHGRQGTATAHLLHEVRPAVVGVVQVVDVLLADAKAVVLHHKQRPAHSPL